MDVDVVDNLDEETFGNDSGKITENIHTAIVGNLNRCSGSSMYTFGDNIVQCSLFGPNPLSSNLNLLKKNYFSVFLYPLGKIKNLTKGLFWGKFVRLFVYFLVLCLDKSLSYYEYFFKRTFNPMVYQALLPRSRTYVVVNEIEKGSSFVTTSLNAVSLTLIDSGYALKYCVGSTGIILDKQDGQFYSEKEYKDKFTKLYRTHEPPCLTFDSPDNTVKATFHIVSKNTNLNTVSLVAEGRFSLQDVFKAKKKSDGLVVDFFEYTKSHVNNRFV